MSQFKNKKSNKVDYIVMGVFVVVIAVVVAVSYYSNRDIAHYMQIIQENIERRLIKECKIVETMVTVEQLQGYMTPEDMLQESYIELRQQLQEYAEENGLAFVYFMRLVGDEVQYIIDSDPDPETYYGLEHFEEPYFLVLEAYAGEAVVNLIGDYQEGWEGLISAYSPIFDDFGNIIAIVGIDISDEEIVMREKKARQLTYVSAIATVILGVSSLMVIVLYKKKAEDYNEASIAKGQFLSRMSHEIRTPMNAIIGLCRMAKKTDDPVKKAEYLDSISSSSDYLLELINGILDISKIEAKKMTLNIEQVSLFKMMKNIEIILESQVKAKQQNLSIEISEHVPEYVYCDKTRLTQIVINLAGNAIKFTPEKGDISISISLIEKTEESCNIGFAIKDTGIGIDSDLQVNLFEAFEQGDGSINRKFGGTGLGLTISKLFIEMMNGTISVISKVNEGSIFKFNVWLEIVKIEDIIEIEEVKEAAVSDVTGREVDCFGMTFLVAEDNKVNQIITKNILEEFGATVEIANNGAECVEMFIQNPKKYQIIFMDIQMPDVDGLEATKRIRSSKVGSAKEIPIVAMTAEVFQEDINTALAAGMNAHIGKPISINEIIVVIKKNLEK